MLRITEYILSSADQLMGFHYLRDQKVSFEGIIVKLDCDVIINQETMEEVIARKNDNYPRH